MFARQPLFWVFQMSTVHLTPGQYVLGLTCLAGEVYLIALGLGRKLYFTFLVFYLYLSVVVVRDILSFYLAHQTISSRFLYSFYYSTGLVIYLLNFCLIFDIYYRVFKPFPAIRKFFQILLFLSFLVLLSLVLWSFPRGQNWWTMMMFEFEKNIRFACSVLLLFIIGIIGYYKVPLNRNLGGILYGMAFNNIANIAIAAIFTHYGESITGTWQVLSVMDFCVALVIWVATLSTVAAPVAPPSLAEDRVHYQTAMPAVARGLARLNSQLSVLIEK